MNKKEVQKRVLRDGEVISLDDFTWDEKTKTFSSDLDCLVLDFSGVWDCTFDTGSDCTFNTGGVCTFDTGSRCTFNTGSVCIFNTGGVGTFNTGIDCTFDTGSVCTFKTGSRCTFNTGSGCTFDTGEHCVVVRRDIYEVIEIPDNTKIRLNEDCLKGYKVLDEEKEITIDGKTIKISNESYESFKKQFCE